MIIFHLVVDLKDFFSYNIDYFTGFWFYIGKLSALLFILTAGISSTLNTSTILRHGCKVFLWGMVLTAATYYYNPLTYIRFGILHFLGCSIVSYKLLSAVRPLWLLLSGILLCGLGYAFTPAIVYSSYLFPLGLITSSFVSIDYYPLIPWYGVFIIGAAFGKSLYVRRQSLFPNNTIPWLGTYLGRNSLVIYIIHQPLILAILYAVHKM